MHAAVGGVWAAFGLVIASGVWAQGGPDEMWRLTTRMQMEGMPLQSTTQQVCMKKGELSPAKLSDDKDCKVTELSTVNNRTTWKVVCSGRDPMTGTGEMTRSRDRLDGRVKLRGRDGGESFEMNMVYSGTLAGSCTYEAAETKVAAIRAQGDAQMAAECRKRLDEYATPLYVGPNAACATMRAEFCARVGTLTQGMRTPAGFVQVAEGDRTALRGKAWEDPARACGVDAAAVRADACRSGMGARNWKFVANHCPAESGQVAAEQCAGRDYTAVMKTEYRDLCQTYASRGGAAGGIRTGAPATGAVPAAKTEPAAPTATDAVKDTLKEGAGALQRLFGR